MAEVDRVRTRMGGRSAQVRQKVFTALYAALATGDPDALSVEELARRSGVHKTTIYRRWMSTSGAIADLLTELTPLETPLPDTGDLRRDLAVLARRISRTLVSPSSNSIVRHVAGTKDPDLEHAARAYWGGLFDHTAEVVRRAQQRGEATVEIDAIEAVESMVAPIYLRLLVTHQSLDRPFLDSVVERTIRLLRP